MLYKTVGWLKKELEKFDDDLPVCAYSEIDEGGDFPSKVYT